MSCHTQCMLKLHLLYHKKLQTSVVVQNPGIIKFVLPEKKLQGVRLYYTHTHTFVCNKNTSNSCIQWFHETIRKASYMRRCLGMEK